jgi:predicted O-methyltransferase YrrM
MQGKKYSDKLLPNQEFFRYLYQGSAPYEAALYNLVASYAADFNASQFKLTTPKNMDFEQMSTPPWQLTLLDALIRFSGAKTVLEIGTFVGHSSMQFARMVGETGHVTTIEVGQEFADIARENFRNNGFEKRITLHQGDAGTILDSLPAASFDLVFVDGSKQDYLDYTLRSEKLLTERGVIVVDDVFFHGDVLNQEPTTDKGLGCKKLLEYFQADGRFNRLLLPVANGILVLYRNRNPD